MSTLLLRLAGPCMGFGGPTLGKRRGTLPFPAPSALLGLLANALGLDRADAAALDRLQAELTFLSREDRLLDGRRVPYPDLRNLDQQNVLVWREGRKKGKAATSDMVGVFGSHRDQGAIILDKEVVYLANASFAVAVTSCGPGLDELAGALVAPARTLFLGRRACLPGAPLVEGVVAEPPLAALRRRAPARALYRGPADLPDWPPDVLPRTFPAATRRAHASGAYLDQMLAEVELEPLA